MPDACCLAVQVSVAPAAVGSEWGYASVPARVSWLCVCAPRPRRGGVGRAGPTLRVSLTRGPLDVQLVHLLCSFALGEPRRAKNDSPVQVQMALICLLSSFSCIDRPGSWLRTKREPGGVCGTGLDK